MDSYERKLFAFSLLTALVIGGVFGAAIGYGLSIRTVSDDPVYRVPVLVTVNLNVVVLNASYYETAWLAFMGQPYDADPNQTYFAISYCFSCEPNSTLVVRYKYQTIYYPESNMTIDAFALGASLYDIQWSLYPHEGDLSQVNVYTGGLAYAMFLGHATPATDVEIFGVAGLSAVAYKEVG